MVTVLTIFLLLMTATAAGYRDRWRRSRMREAELEMQLRDARVDLAATKLQQAEERDRFERERHALHRWWANRPSA